MASADTDVVVLSVKVAKQGKPRPPQLPQESRSDYPAESQDPGGPRHVKQEVRKKTEVKHEVKEELEEEQESQTGKVAETKLELKDVKKEVKEEASKDAQDQEVKTEIKQESSKDIKVEVKEETTRKEVKQEVKDEVSKDADMEVKEESNEVVSSRRRMRTKVKAEIKHEVKQEDKKSHRESTGVKQEKVDEDQPVQILQEGFDPPVPKRRRLSQKGPDVSVPSFESRLTEWVEKCLAFQSSGKTWLPTKPCCPASPFLGLAAAPWQGCVGDKTTSCVQLLAKEQFRELRDFYRENPHHALFHDNSSPSSERQTETTPGSRPLAHRNSTGNQHRAAECMKMWPWMRDLPTRAWAGNGWLLVEDGMMKLSPTGGGSAMQGLEIFESVGSVPEPGEPSSRAEPRAEEGQVVTRSFRGLERQSGIQNINWSKEMSTWRVQWKRAGKVKVFNFPISKHMKLGLAEAEAVEAALEEAKAFREELVRQGKLKPPKPVTEKAGGSTVRGVKYIKKTGTWRAELTDPSTKKSVHGGYFKVKEEAEAKARELAKELGVECEGGVVPVKPLSELPNFEPLGPQPGIKWNLGEQAWKAQCNVSGRKRCMRFRPKDFSAKELEKSWKQAVAWRKQQEKERAQGQQPRKC